MAIFSKKKEEKTAKAEQVSNSKAKVAKATEVKSKAKAAPKKATKKVVKKDSDSSTSAKSDKKPFHVRKRKGRRQTAKQNMATELSRVLLRPRITEKATDVTANGTYVFEVAVKATKRDVSKAVEHYYKVTPTKVNMIKIPSKKRRNRNRRTFGQSSVGKKAYVFLKKGDSIEFV